MKTEKWDHIFYNFLLYKIFRNSVTSLQRLKYNTKNLIVTLKNKIWLKKN